MRWGNIPTTKMTITLPIQTVNQLQALGEQQGRTAASVAAEYVLTLTQSMYFYGGDQVIDANFHEADSPKALGDPS